jgi:hypothetical protein
MAISSIPSVTKDKKIGKGINNAAEITLISSYK